VTFSTSALHALRTLAWLAANAGEQARLGRDLAREVDVPPDYLAKVLAQLARAGVLSASRGAKGGYRLARPPHRIRLIDVVLPFEGKRARPGCLLRPERPCGGSGRCTAHRAWSGVRRTYVDFLERTTVADIGSGARTGTGR
jgi:Rrf2 family protein